MNYRGDLNTEQQNKNSLDIDKMEVDEILHAINNEDASIADVVKSAIPQIEETVNHAVASVKNGGRVFYVGAGTSGRLGVLDASEIPPTFSASLDNFNGIIAGGDKALRRSIEGAEDSVTNAIRDLEKFNLDNKDTLIGISCSGAASYVISALDHAREREASTVYIVTNPKPHLMTKVDTIIYADTGPEIITGSTRMKAGTATKMILNMISTTVMVKLGKVYGNLMVDLMAVNHKLVDRGTRIIMQVSGLDYEDAKKKLMEADRSVKLALVMQCHECDAKEGRRKLKEANGHLNRVIEL
ncbi:MAG: N-acetylmuramic acid 6-phosphate etherase [Candidatus Marinimicrobia bacterium]|nr:N-acetylmuramic acid 6-phosphate etherase [Candidatus Neomarinimicrobiota bacterium]